MAGKDTKITTLLDGVSISEIALSKETRQLSEMAKDPALSMVDRLESFEDITNIEVGDTSLTRARNLEREMDIRQLYLKFEGGNPTGTQKDRIAFAQCHEALRWGYAAITVATCGNYGVAVALAANLAGIQCIIFIPGDYHTQRIQQMELLGAIVKRVEGTYEDSVTHSIEQAKLNEWYDANPGGQNTSLQLLAYAEIANEIYDQLRDAPKYVAVPVSNGTLLAGIYRGFVSLYKRGRTSRIPKMIAGSSSHKNPIVQSFLKGLTKCEDLDPALIKETKVNEPLINWHSFDGDEALYAIKASGGSAVNISDERMLKLARLLKEKEGLNVLPASTAGLAALLTLHRQTGFEPDRYVAILTGKK